MALQYTRDELVARLVRAGEIEVTGEDIETVGDYFAPGFEFNGPGGFVADFNGLLDYFASGTRGILTTGRFGAASSSSTATPSHAKRGSRGPSSASSPNPRPAPFSPTDARSSGNCSTSS